MQLISQLLIAAGFGGLLLWRRFRKPTQIDLGNISEASINDAVRREERKGWDGPSSDWRFWNKQ